MRRGREICKRALVAIDWLCNWAESNLVERWDFVQPENKFDQLSKRLAVAVSRRSLLRLLSVALAGALLPFKNALADYRRVTSAELEKSFFSAPSILELRNGANVERRCVAVVAAKNSEDFALGSSSTKDGECPSDIASYFENSDIQPEMKKGALFDSTKLYAAKVIAGRTYLEKTYPIAHFYSYVNPDTGKEEIEAFCFFSTYLDPRVHKNQVERKVIYSKRKPIPQTLISLDDDVTCGDINFAYENEIKTRKPVALRDFAEDTAPHATSSVRLNATNASAENQSGHKMR